MLHGKRIGQDRKKLEGIRKRERRLVKLGHSLTEFEPEPIKAKRSKETKQTAFAIKSDELKKLTKPREFYNSKKPYVRPLVDGKPRVKGKANVKAARRARRIQRETQVMLNDL